MKYKLLFSPLLFAIGLVFSSLNFAESKNEKWDAYMDAIDPYANESDKLKPQNSKTPKKKKPNYVIKPRDLPPNATPQQISDYNQRMQKYMRANQYEEVENLFETVESMGYPPKESEALKPDFTINHPEVATKGYSSKKTNFSWGGKQTGYKYVDYEFVFESTNHAHVEQMSKVVSELSLSGWEVDLNRTFQSIEGAGEEALAITTSQMRFRKRN